MSVTPHVLNAFVAWRDAELAEVAASPCPEDQMALLVEATSAAIAKLAAIPATTPEDLALKLLPLAVCEMGRRTHGGPFALVVDDDSESDIAALWHGLVRDLPIVSTEVRATMEMPRPEGAR